MTKAFRAIAAISLALCTAAAGTAASAQGWPTAKPITMVVPVPPGPTVDMLARLVAAKLQDSLGQTVIVDNRGGANGMIGSSFVANAAPDGYTLLAATPASHVTAVHLMKNLPVDPVKDFTPIMAAAEPVTALIVNADLPVNSVQELIAYAKANPGKLSYGSSGVGSVFHLTGELFNRIAGVNITHVPYRGVAQPMQDTAAGHIQLLHISLSSARGALASGKAKVLAILEPKRYGKMPNMPSITESPSGVPQAFDLVRLLRAREAAAGDSRAAQCRDAQGHQCPGRAREDRGQRHDDHRRHAAGVRRAAERRHREVRRDHQGGRHQAGVSRVCARRPIQGEGYAKRATQKNG